MTDAERALLADLQRKRRTIGQLARVDAAQSPLPVAALTSWRARYAAQDRWEFDALWSAACWQAAALEAMGDDRRANCLAQAREVVAIARGEITAAELQAEATAKREERERERRERPWYQRWAA